MTLEESLGASLLLETEEGEEKVQANSLQFFQLGLHPYGFEATIDFSIFEDEGDAVDQLFAKETPITATLELKPSDVQRLGDVPLKLKGIVRRRAYQGQGERRGGESLRLYSISFSDSAKATWGNHFPIKVYVDETMKGVLDAEKNPLISLEYEWDTLEEEHPILAFSLEYDRLLSEDNQISFYSFLMFYLHKEGGILQYNFKEDSYKLVGKKEEAGDPVEITNWWVTPPVCFYPNMLRAVEKTLTHSSQEVEDEDEENPNAFQGVSQDAFDSESYTELPEQNRQQVMSEVSAKNPEIQFFIQELAEAFTFKHLIPGTLVKFQTMSIKEKEWCNDPIFKGQIFRMNHILIRGVSLDTPSQVEKETERFSLNIKVIAETKEEEKIPRPDFISPTYPFSICGRVLSKIGEEEQTTFNIVKGKGAPQGSYEVIVPLAGEEKKVIVPFSPDFLPGQFYFPLYKDQEVLLSMYFQTAKIERFLDRRPLVDLPHGTQGNQVVFASNGKDKYTFLRHEYKDGKDSILTVKQSSSETQTQMIEIQEKELQTKVEDEGSRTLRILMNRDSGITITFEDKDGGVTQETNYNDQAITHTSKGDGGTSTITQKPDSVTLKAKKITLEAEEEVVIDAKKTVGVKGGSKVGIEAPIVEAKDTVKLG